MLDRFRTALPEAWRPGPNYRIAFPKRGDYEEFLRQQKAQSPDPTKFEHIVASMRLPPPATGHCAQLVCGWWRKQLAHDDVALLSFAMINRLVLLLLDSNPRIVRALRLTYPFVLLDEFQATTRPQFELLRAIFEGTGSVLTAVGDDLQRIMGWAGAMRDGFERFAQTFGAEQIELSWNWRVHPELAKVQAYVAQQVLGTRRQPTARAQRVVQGDSVAIWAYATDDTEAKGLAHWLANEIGRGAVKPEEVAILVRQKAETVETRLRPAFEAEGLRLRNVARPVGEISIQELLAEPLTAYLLPILALATRRRDAEARTATLARLAALDALEDDDKAGHRRVAERLDREIGALRAQLRGVEPGDVSSLPTPDLVGRLERVFGESRLRAIHPAYRRTEDFARVRTGFVQLLDECRANAASWEDVTDRFAGKGQIALMTIHKAKGLEFHTMVFYGLDAADWWSLQPGKDEERRNFYVALSRAKQRAIFTRAEGRGAAIGWLEQILGEGGVPVRRIGAENHPPPRR